MRAIRFAVAGSLLAAAALLAAPAARAAGQWYARADLSYNHVADNAWGSPNGPVDTQSSNGVGLDLAWGNDLGRVWVGGAVRGEFELKFKYNDVDGMDRGGRTLTGVTGHTRVLAFMYNLYDDFMPESGVDPYIGAGIGYANVRFGNYYGYDAATHTQYALDSSASVFAYQAFAGIKVRLSRSLNLDLAYNWFVLGNVSLSEGAGTTGTTYHTSSATLGVDWSF